MKNLNKKQENILMVKEAAAESAKADQQKEGQAHDSRQP